MLRSLDNIMEQVVTGTELQVCDKILVKVNTFKYLDRVIYFVKSDWPNIVRNLHISWIKWVRLCCLLGR